jgi:hypothetical protein
MKTSIGFALVGSFVLVCAGLSLPACNSVSTGGLSSHGGAGGAKSTGGGPGSTGRGGSGAGASGSGGVTGRGGSVSSGTPGTGGVASTGGVTGRGGSGGTLGSGGLSGSGGAGVGGSGRGGSSGLDGGAGRGGSGGRGGATGSGGSVGTGGTTARDAAPDRNIPCGSTTCAAGEYCCSASCGLCAPTGATCVAIACLPDAGLGIDAGGCTAVPAADSILCGSTQPPHAYVCVLSSLPAPCVAVNITNATDTYCCP